MLVDLLQHEVAVLSFLRRRCGQLALADPAVDAVAVDVDDAHRSAANLCDVPLLEEHKAARHGQQRRDVRCNEILLDAEPYDHRTTLSRENQAVRIALAHHRQRVGALEFGHHGAHGVEKIAGGLELMVDAVRDDLRIGLRAEGVAGALQLRTQLLVVFDDAVMHDRQAARHVRVCVALARHAVRGPTRVCDADPAVERRTVERILQRLHFANHAYARQVIGIVHDGHAGRVIAAILEPS